MTQSISGKAQRLRHDLKAHIRAIQISNKTAFVYCEGRDVDPYLYSELTTRALLGHSDGFDLFRVEEIAGSGGKQELIKIFKVFRGRGLLNGSFKGKGIRSAFLLDKDVDDIKRCRLKSAHVLYTAQYDLEGQIMSAADLKRSIAVSLSIPIEKVPARYVDAHTWVENKAKDWKSWIELCLYSAIYNIDWAAAMAACRP